MLFQKLILHGAYLIELKPIEDERGFFARTFCRATFQAQGLNSNLDQCSLSYNRHTGTVRGMHYQAAPHAEAKLIRCVRGAIHDIIVDLRPESPTYRRSVGVDLSSSSRTMLYVPEGFAHGFQTLEPDTEVFYQISAPFVPEASRGVRWNDPALHIQWPLPISVISQKDQEYPPLCAE